MTDAVFDCVVLLQAAANQAGAAGACVAFVESGQVKLHLSPAILNEARDVFSRPEIRRRFPRLTQEKADRYLLKIATLATLMHDIPVAAQLPRDPTDEPYLNLALAAQAPFLVTRDKDLLSLMQDKTFRKAFPALSIVEPAAFLARVRAELAGEAETA